jgi:hypothetical protein
MILEGSGNTDPSRSRIIEYEQYRKDRSIVWVESNCRFLRDKNFLIINGSAKNTLTSAPILVHHGIWISMISN